MHRHSPVCFESLGGKAGGARGVEKMSDDDCKITMRFETRGNETILLVVGRAVECIAQDGTLRPFIRSTSRTEMIHKLSGSERQ